MAGFVGEIGTTSLIIGWGFVFSLILMFAMYETVGRTLVRESAFAQGEFDRSGDRLFGRGVVLVPAVMLVPLLIWFSYLAFKTVLIFPPGLMASAADLNLHAIAPALVLLVSAGFVGSARRVMASEIRFWAGRPFVRLSLALGKDPHAELRRLIVARSFSEIWSATLPWFFGELIVVEALFNAPGLGTSLWEAARRLDHTEAAKGLLVIFAIFFFTNEVNRRLSRWVGVRLESYG